MQVQGKLSGLPQDKGSRSYEGAGGRAPLSAGQAIGGLCFRNLL